ncbi:conserved oligomeric Golgi complex subunit 2-like isoform X2 [Euphorbia lathyris]|uniref:conserved oligomeric Golgi complex subunit 2-like isoform X2 n=1 Tax=Euphorbia lathyris TaxID=212925 RepID=UPI00331440A3
MVGNVPLGSDHPIRVQTMTTSDTKDVAGTVEEVEKLIKELPSVPTDWSNGDLSSNMKNAMSNDTSLQSIENGSNIRETQSMLLERIAIH